MDGDALLVATLPAMALVIWLLDLQMFRILS